MNIILPKLHVNQKYILNNCKRFNVLNIGRRFGKDILLNNIAIISALEGKKVLFTAPEYKLLKENWRVIKDYLGPWIKHVDGDEKRIELKTKGLLRFFSLENFNSIRGGKYHVSIHNEFAWYPHAEEAWQEAIRPTLSDYKGTGWFSSTPKADNFFKTIAEYELKPDHPNWKTFHYTSYDNPRIDPSEFDEAKRDLPDLKFRQEYLAEFVDGSGALMERSYLRYFNILPEKFDRIVMAVDPAISEKATADFTGIAIMGLVKGYKRKNEKDERIETDDKYYLLDVYRDRIDFITTQRMIQLYYDKWRPSQIGIEKVAYQTSLIQELRRKTSLPIVELLADKDKVTRFYSILNKYSLGLIYHAKNLLQELESELLSFPLGQHDDLVDAVTYAFIMLNKPVQGFQFF